MITYIEKDNGNLIHIRNEKLSCLLRIHYGKAELLHLGAPLSETDSEALRCDPVLGWGMDVLYKEGDPRSCLDVLPLAWSERGTGDYRETPIELLLDDEDVCPDFVFASAEPLKPEELSSALPHARGAQDAIRLIFTSANRYLQGLTLELRFVLFETALVRQAVLVNHETPILWPPHAKS